MKACKIPAYVAGALVVTGLAAMAMMGCGDDEHADAPSNAVVTIGGTPIARAEFDRQLDARLKRSPSVPGVSAKVRREMFKRIVLQQLILSEWVEREAARNHVDVSDQEAKGFYEEVRQAGDRATQAGGDASSYNATLEAAAGEENKRRSYARTVLLREKIVAKRVAHLPRISDAAAREYYRSHKKSLISKEQRYFQLVLTKSHARAAQAKKELIRGKSWEEVSRAFSIDNVYLRHPTGLTGAIEGELAAPLEATVFRARRGTIRGPVRTQAGWYVIEVQVITPPHQQQLGEVTHSLKLQLGAGRSDRISKQLIDQLRERYEPRTICAKALLVLECKNDAGARRQFIEATGQQPPS